MKERLDKLVASRNLAETREKARALIMAGNVYVNGMKEDKCGQKFDLSVEITVRNTGLAYVSRGGYKLEKAMTAFGLQLEDRVCMDIGASTGGFTDCMLQNGAKKVFAVDVGYGQLAWKLRCHEKVIVMEKTNIRNVTLADIGERIDFASVDVSFISLQKVLPVAEKLLQPEGSLVALIKPQFEAGREKVGKKGVVRDKKVHLEVIENTLAFLPAIGLYPVALTFSPIKGPEGNIEFLLYVKKQPAEDLLNPAEIVETAHRELNLS